MGSKQSFHKKHLYILANKESNLEIGLNTKKENFKSNINSDTGFHFTTVDNLTEYFNSCKHKNFVYIYDAKLAPDSTVAQTHNKHLWRTNKIVIEYKHYMLNPYIVKNWKLPMESSEYYIDKLCELGDIETLKKWNTFVIYSTWKTYYNASVGGFVDILTYIDKNTTIITHDFKPHIRTIIDNTSKCGNYHVLEWWKTSNFPFDYTHKAFDDACANGHIKTLEWWKCSGLKLKYTKDALINALLRGNTNTADWILENKLDIVLMKDDIWYIINTIKTYDKSNSLVWFKRNYPHFFI